MSFKEGNSSNTQLVHTAPEFFIIKLLWETLIFNFQAVKKHDIGKIFSRVKSRRKAKQWKGHKNRNIQTNTFVDEKKNCNHTSLDFWEYEDICKLFRNKKTLVKYYLKIKESNNTNQKIKAKGKIHTSSDYWSAVQYCGPTSSPRVSLQVIRISAS